MKTKLINALRWCVRQLPEVLLCFFLASLLPLVFLVLREVVRQTQKFLGGPGQYGGWLWDNIWQTLGVLVCLLGVAGLVFLLASNRTIVWAVARKLILEALHRKVVLVLLVFFIVLMPVLPFVLTTEGSQKSQVQLVLLYSLVLGLVLLSLLAIFMTTASVCSEVERKQVHITDTKPMRRWQYLLGKWFGAVVLCAAVLGIMTAGTYLLVAYVARPPDLRKLPPDEAMKAKADQEKLADEVFVSRKSSVARLPDVDKEAREMALKDLATKTYGWAFNSAVTDNARQLLFRSQTVRGGSVRLWGFGGMQPNQNGKLSVRFKPYLMGALQVYGQWQAYNRKEEPAEGGQVKYSLVPVGVPYNAPPTGWEPNAFYEVPMAASNIAPDGTIWMAFANTSPGTTVIFDIDHPVEVMQREEGFTPNYYRSMVIIMIHVSLLAALGVMAGALFSFPVASLLAVCMFIGGMIAPWFTEQFVKPDIYAKLTSVTVYVDWAWRTFAAAVIAPMPNFGSYSPLTDLVNGRAVSLGHVAVAGAVLLCLKGGLALLVGMYFYSRRELAQTIV